MKILKKLTFKKALLTCLAVFTTMLCAAFGVSALKPTQAKAEDGTLSSTVYQTDGASVRVFKWNGSSYEGTDRQGIRFHVETGANYLIPGTSTPLLDTTQKNQNGSYKMAEGYKSYTLIIPTRLMGGSNDLTKDLNKVMAIETTEYWFSDKDGNWESVAYIHNIPQKWYTDEYTYRGIVVKVDGETETPVMWTPMERRSLAWVAKQAYNDTIVESTNLWGSSEKDKEAAPLIKKFIPTYTINYADGSAPEKVLWGDKIAGVDTTKTYYDETNHEPIDVTKPLEMAMSTTIKLSGATVSNFVFTGVEYTAEGFNVFATLPTGHFGHDVELEPSTIDMVTDTGKVIKATSAIVHVEGTGSDAVSKLMIGFSYENISNGTTLTILKTTHFYNNGNLYNLSKDYTFEYYNQTWELPLGQITLVNIETIINYTETVNGTDEHDVRITFKENFLINGDVAFKNADGTDAKITITCPENNNQVKKTISDGYYYWNQGGAKILEIPGAKGGNFWGEHDGDVMTIPAGTRVYQNNGYYLVSETITATFNGGGSDGKWVFEPKYHEIDASHFLSAYTRQEGDVIYIDVTTQDRWATECVEVVCNDGQVTYHHTDNVTKHELINTFYHGENNHQILRFHLHEFSVTGDWVTIPAGIEFWVGNDVYTLTEEVKSYFVDTKQWNSEEQQWDGKGATWITNHKIEDVFLTDFTSIQWYENNIRFETKDIWSTKANNKVIIDDTYINGVGVETHGTNYNGFYYYGGTNNLLEMQGVNFDATGGSVTLKEGIFFWLFDNQNHFAYVNGYRLAEDIVIQVSGVTGSPIYKDVEVYSITKADIASLVNDGAHDGEIRVHLNSKIVTNMYGAGEVEGSATLKGEATTSATTSAYVYAEHPTIGGYTGNTIIAFTGAFGKPFQATKKGDLVTIAAGTKVWLSNSAGYVTFAEELNYVWNGSAYVPQEEHNVTIDSGLATVTTFDGDEITGPITAKTGKRVTFKVVIPENYMLASVTNATETGDNTYTTDYLFDDVTVTVNCFKPISIEQSSIESIIAYYDKDNPNDFEGFRLQLKETDEINAIKTVSSGAFEGAIEMKVGATTAPTTFRYYGDGNRMIAIGCDISGMEAGDYLTVKAGSIFIYDTGIFKVKSDIKIITVTANFNANVNGFSVMEGSAKAVGMDSGKPLAKFAGVQLTFTYGWKNGSEATHTLAAVRFNGEDKGNSGTYNVTLNEATTIEVVTVEKAKYTVTWSNPTGATISVKENGSEISSGATVVEGTTISVSVTASSGYRLNTVTIGGTNQSGVNTSEAGSSTFNYTVNAATSISATTVKMYKVSWTPTNATYAVTNVTTGATISTSGTYVDLGTKIRVQISNSGRYTVNKVTINGSQVGTAAGTFEHTVESDTTIKNTVSSSCIVEGTMIMMADGTQKAVETLTYNDKLLAFNHTTGEVETADMAVLGHEGQLAELHRVINLTFSNGKVLRIVGSHGLYDMNLNEYVFIMDYNAHQFIGHEFYTTEYVSGSFVAGTVVLTDVSITEEVVRIFSPSSYKYMNCFAEGMLNVTGTFVNRGEFVNMFEFNEDLTYNAELMQKDVEKYGLYTYEDFEEYMPYEVFEKLPFDVLKVSVGKGLITWDEILLMIEDLKSQPGVY